MAAAYVSPLECQICTATYDDNEHEPKLLTCHHTLCLSCIVHLANRNIVTCPNKCNQVTALPVLSSEEQSQLHKERLTRQVKNLQHSFYIDTIRRVSCTAVPTQWQGTGKREPRMRTRSMCRASTVPSCHHPLTNRPVAKIGCRGSGSRQLNPNCIAVDSTGMIYVSDIVNKQIQKLNSDGEYVRHWRTKGFELRLLAFNHQHNELICGIQRNGITNDVIIYSPAGKIKKQFTITDTSDISGLAVNSCGEIVCSDTCNNIICVVSHDGDSIFNRFGGRGSAPGQFNWPYGVCIGPDDDIVVADGWNHRIQIFDCNGQFKHQFGTEGYGNGQFKRALSLVIDQYGQILVSDIKRKDVQVFSYTGEFIRCIDSKDDKMASVTGLAVTHDHHVLVTDSTINRIFKFKYM